MERLILKAVRISLEFIFVCKLFLRKVSLRRMVSGFVQWTVCSERSRNSSDGHIRSYLRLQDKHLSPKHLIKLFSIQRKQTKRKTRIHHPQLINEEPSFRQIFMLPSSVVLENKPLKKPTLNSNIQSLGAEAATSTYLNNFMGVDDST